MYQQIATLSQAIGD